MKHEWKKQEKEWYGATHTPAILDLPEFHFITISGKGNPNETDFSDRVGVLYSLAYAIKMAYKAAAVNAKKVDASTEIHDFSVYPLEGVWSRAETGRLIKEELEYTIMIRQPDFITEDMVKAALEKVTKKKFSPLLEHIRFQAMQDGRCVEILHTGSFDDEPASFEKMDEFVMQNGWQRLNGSHREIYLNNANRVPAGRLQTILRYQIK